MGILDNLRNLMGSKEHDDPAAAIDEPAETGDDHYTVQSGDTLWSIAQSHYGDGSHYLQIFEANKAMLDSPEHILPGQELVLPKLGN